MAASGTPVRMASIDLLPNYRGIPVEFRPILAKRLQAIEEQVIDAGYEFEMYALSPEEGAVGLGPKLQAQRPDAVVIGNGVRFNMELTHFMEQIIDTANERTACQVDVQYYT